MLDLDHIQERLFTTGDIAAIVGVSRSVVSDWLAREIISAPQAPGRGHSRRFSFWNIVQAWIARDLNRMGIRAGEIRRIFAVLDVEMFQLNTGLIRPGGANDCVLLIGFGPDGSCDWVRRETEDLRRHAADFDDTVVVLRIDVNAAVRRTASEMVKRSRGQAQT